MPGAKTHALKRVHARPKRMAAQKPRKKGQEKGGGCQGHADHERSTGLVSKGLRQRQEPAESRTWVQVPILGGKPPGQRARVPTVALKRPAQQEEVGTTPPGERDVMCPIVMRIQGSCRRAESTG